MARLPEAEATIAGTDLPDAPALTGELSATEHARSRFTKSHLY